MAEPPNDCWPMNHGAKCLDKRIGVAKDAAVALDWYRKASEGAILIGSVITRRHFLASRDSRRRRSPSTRKKLRMDLLLHSSIWA